MKKVLLKIEGMTCSACSSGLEKFLNRQEGIISANVNLVMANSLIEYDETKLDVKKIEGFVKKAGFKSLGLYKEDDEEKENKREKVTFIVFGVLAVILLYISMGPMIGLPVPSFISYMENPINYAIVLCVFSIAFIIYGLDIIISGFKNLFHRSPNMDTLVSIGVISSFAYSVYSMIMLFNGNLNYVHELYFESAGIVIFFIKLGRYLDGISKNKTKDAIKKLVQITPKSAIIKINDEEKECTIDEIKEGDIVVCRPGDRIAVDGEITEGKTHLDEAFITGESKPVGKTVGDKVIAGSINYDGYIEYKALKIGRDSTISQIVRLVVEATNTRAPIAKIADKVSGIFVPTIILIAIISFISYLLLGYDVGYALNTFVTILVIACPCALGLATPLAIVVSEGTAANNGILIKKSEVLENAKKIDTIVFDKTGTLTYGKLKISEIINNSSMSDRDLIQVVGSIEKMSTHPIGMAFVQYLNDNNINSLEVSGFNNISGIGVSAKVGNNEYVLGNRKAVEHFKISNNNGANKSNNIEANNNEINNSEVDNKNIKENNNYEEIEADLTSKGNSIVYVIENKRIIAIIGVNDIIRENAKDVIRNLKALGVEPVMLTGDNKKTANIIAKEIGIDNVISDVLPTEKAETIKKLKAEGKKVMMCGDGINDSPALAICDIGVSVNSGTDIAMDSADVILMRNDLSKIIQLIKISKMTIKNIKQNLFWAFFYNGLMIPVAIGFFKPIGITINPMIASIAMTLSSLTVILNALRLVRIKE